MAPAPKSATDLGLEGRGDCQIRFWIVTEKGRLPETFYSLILEKDVYIGN
jgi:hypothetical protein